MASNRDYEVGYKKPPRATRFRKGQSGNPRGRPRCTQDLYALLVQALRKKVTVTENGRRRRIAKLEAVLTQFTNRAAQGDLNAARWLIDLLAKNNARSGQSNDAVSPRDQEEAREYLENYLDSVHARLRETHSSQVPGTTVEAGAADASDESDK